MKRVLTAILLLIYFTVTTGVVVSLHYCMDRFDSVRVGTDASDECGNCGMHKGENECCWDDVEMVKLQSAHMAVPFAAPDFSIDMPALQHDDGGLLSLQQPGPVAFPLAHGPPLPQKDICVMNCVFRI